MKETFEEFGLKIYESSSQPRTETDWEMRVLWFLRFRDGGGGGRKRERDGDGERFPVL